jgi:hypothetical protein
LDGVFPGRGSSRRVRQSPEFAASLQDWLRGRAAALLPGRPVSRAEFRWYMVRASIVRGELRTKRDFVEKFVISLDAT